MTPSLSMHQNDDNRSWYDLSKWNGNSRNASHLANESRGQNVCEYIAFLLVQQPAGAEKVKYNALYCKTGWGGLNIIFIAELQIKPK